VRSTDGASWTTPQAAGVSTSTLGLRGIGEDTGARRRPHRYAWHSLDLADLFIFAGNELLVANLLTSSQSAQPAPVFLTSFITSQGLFLAKISAAAVAVSIPVLVAGFAAQDKLVQGLSMGAVK
jgi:hypothetical protein